MSISITRRAVVTALVMAVPTLLTPRPRANEDRHGVEDRIADLEARTGGRLGVALLDIATGRLMGTRADERFAMCSTFKVLAAAFVLARIDRGEEQLDRRITFTERDLVPPFTATNPRAGPGGMTVEELCQAAVTVSDSTAANLLFRWSRCAYGIPAIAG